MRIVQIADHLEIEIEHFVEIAALGSGFCQDHRKMKAYRSDVETSDKYRFIVLICRLHAAALVPRAKKARHPIGLMTLLYFLYILAI